MKIFVLTVYAILIVSTAIVGINTVQYLKKKENAEIESIRRGLDHRIKILQILTILLVIFGVIVTIDSNFKILK